MGADRDVSLIHCGSVSVGICSSWLRICWSEGAVPFSANRSKVLREATACSDARIITRARSPREIFGPAVNLLTARVMRTSVRGGRILNQGSDAYMKPYSKSKREDTEHMAVNVKPLGDRGLIQPLEEKEGKKGGIIIPDTAKEKPQEGTVVAHHNEF